jgi:[acyl-carrier-protein] S-malonyltransferase
LSDEAAGQDGLMKTDPQAETAIIFPGISPVARSVIAKFLLINPAARALTVAADDALGYSLMDRYLETESDYSEPARVAFLVSCLALAEWIGQEFGSKPEICAGPSFGGTPCAVYSGALEFQDAVRMTAGWTGYVDEYFKHEHRDVVTQSFARTPADVLTTILGELTELAEWHDVACYVDHDFYLVSVRESRLDWLNDRVRALGGLPLYTMRPPMHSPAFSPLRDTIGTELLGPLDFADPAIPIICDHDGTLLQSGDEVRKMLLDAITRPVRWPLVISALKELGVGKLYVSGQDRLWGRVPCTTDNFDVTRLESEMALRPRARRRRLLPHEGKSGPQRTRCGEVLHLQRVIEEPYVIFAFQISHHRDASHGIQPQIAQTQVCGYRISIGKKRKMFPYNGFETLIPHALPPRARDGRPLTSAP